MIISGFQPLSLLDYPGIICSIVFTQGCPFRCVYCHNPELIPTQAPNANNVLKEEDILEHLNREDGITIILVTHEPDIAAYASRELVMKDGQIVQDVRREPHLSAVT